MRLYAATYDCPHCGKRHHVAGGGTGVGMVINDGPDQPSTAAELWPRGDYPPAVAGLLGDLVWCDGLGEYVELGDPERLRVAPG